MPAHAATVVKLDLWDKGSTSMEKLNSEPIRGLTSAAQLGVMMGITATPSTFRAGQVAFEATNRSTDIVHEVILAPVPNAHKEMPYHADEMKVDEDKAIHLGEVSELAVGKTGELLIALKPGKYVLYCNVPGHYALGMWTEINVIP